MDLMEREVIAHCPDATAEQRQEIAEAVVAEVVARLRRGGPGGQGED